MDDSIEGIAIIGLAGRFPGARDVDELWRNLRDGVDAITSFSDDELRAARVPDTALVDPAYVKAGPVLDDVDRFDADFFGISAHEAELTDPQQRLFLECAWEALEQAGYDADRLDGRVGVFAGAGLNTYLLQLAAARDILNSPDAFQAMIANDKDYLATRVSYKLNLRGPSMSVQTACSTSLVAVHLACQSLLGYQADMALAGGVSITLPQRSGYHYQPGMIFSPDGRCRPFDADAAGTVGGSGVGLVVLKRVADAIADGDTIYAVIRGSAVNNDGAAKLGFTAPSVDGQAEVIAEALALAGVEPDSIDYVEAHGTGTPLGDPIELAALRRVFGQGRGPRTCALGSLKSNVGHLDTAAGVTGLIKAALALHHGQIPPTLHFQSPNPDLELDQSPFYVSSALVDWPAGADTRRAGVSSFGIGGTNAHVVLEEAPVGVARPEAAEAGPSLLVLSARTPAALDAASERLASLLRQHPDASLADVAYTLQSGRREHPHRRVLMAETTDEAAEALSSGSSKRVWSGTPTSDQSEVAFLFPGQGAQYVGMARGLYDSLPVFRATVDRCAERLQPILGLDIRTILFAEPAEAEAARQQLTQTALAQPALFTIELALARQWESWGVTPAAVVGHSLGEYVAACLAGVFGEDDALALVAERGYLMQSCPSGAMLGVPLSETDVTEYLDGQIALAAVNGPTQCVLGGPHAAIDDVEARLRARGIGARRLVTSHAFHTPLMAPAVATFAARVAQTTRREPTLPWVSTVTGTWISAEEATSPEYWARQIRRTVRFWAAVKTLLEDPARVLLEVGPGRTLASLARLQLPERRTAGLPDAPIVGSVRHPDDPTSDLDVLLSGLGRLWLTGVSVAWAALHIGKARSRLPLPTYPFERRRYWVDAPASAASGTHGLPAAAHNAAPETTTGGQYARPTLATAYVAPTSDAERQIATLWQELLGVAQIGIHDDFFELGGHSLLATQLVARLRDLCGVELPIRALFETPTVATLAVVVEQQRTADPSPRPAPVVPIARDGQLPLSFSQQRLWFLDQLEPGSAAYTMPFALRLVGPLDPAALRNSLDEVVRRHEVLRTTFPTVDGAPGPLIAPTSQIEIPIVDLQAVEVADREAETRRLAAEEAGRPFDLAHGPLLRASLLRLAADEHVLLLTMHHIVSDGWSIGVLVRELTALYDGALAGEPATVPGLPVQYADYAHWQRELLQGPLLDEQLGYWRERLADAPALLELPADRPRSAVQRYTGATFSFELPAELTASVQALSREHGVTPFMTLLAAFETLLLRYSRQDDFVIGTPIANRTRAETEGLIGCFVNTLALRADLTGDPTFGELLERTRELTLGAYAHQDLPFDQLVEALQPDRALSHSPIFQVMFVLQSAWNVALAGLEVQEFPVESGISQFDLSLALSEGETGLVGAFEYSTDLFDEATIARMAEHFRVLLQSIVEDAGQRLSELSLLGDQERDQLSTWSGTCAPYPEQATIHQLVEAQAARTPEAIAVIQGDRQLSYGELNARANQLAHYLRRLGVRPDVRVGLCLERSIEQMIGLLGILKAGGAYLPLDPTYPADRLAYILEDSAVSVLLTRQRLLGGLPAHQAQVLCLDADWESIATEPATTPSHTTSPDDIAYVIYTSGSTGRPKGVLVPHRGVVNHATAIVEQFGVQASDRVLQFASLGFDAAAEEIYPTWLTGATLVLRTDEMLATYHDFQAFAERERLTVLDLPTAFWHEWVRELERTRAALPETLRLVIVGGEKALPERIAAWRAIAGERVRWADTYGPTETTVTATIYEPGGASISTQERRGVLTSQRVYRGALTPQPPLPAAGEGETQVPTIGRPIANARVSILDAGLRPVPIGVPGELCIGGVGLARGYLNRPELTAERFVPDPSGERPGERLYRTGDLARFRPDGSIEYLGRLDHQVKIRGFRVELGEIEEALSLHPDVAEGVVLALDDEHDGKRLIAYIVGKEQPGPAGSDLRAFLKLRLPEYMVPSAFVSLDAMPLTPSGKLDRRALPAPGTSTDEQVTHFVAPRDPVEAVLAGIWRDVLTVQDVGADDNFFDLGGHSLLATLVISRVRETFQIGLPLRTLFEAPTVAGLAEALIAQEPVPGRVMAIARLRQKIGGLSADAVKSALQSRRKVAV